MEKAGLAHERVFSKNINKINKCLAKRQAKILEELR